MQADLYIGDVKCPKANPVRCVCYWFMTAPADSFMQCDVCICIGNIPLLCELIFPGVSWKKAHHAAFREENEDYHYNCPCSQKGVCVAFPLVWLMLIVCHCEYFKNQFTFTCMLQDTSF